MNRTKLIWLAFLACAGVMGGAMALVTHHALSLEKARLQSDAEAELGEKERLALWRMDTEAASMLVMENNRPPAEFRAFAKPDNTYDSDYRNFAKGRVLLPSPLLAETPEHSILYFEIDEHGIARSPQVPESGERALALKQGLAKGLLDERAASLARLRGILRSKPDMVSAGGGNIDMVVAAANSSTPEIPAQAVQPAQQNAPDHPNGQMEDMRRQILQQGKDGQQAMPPSGNVGKEEEARLNEYNSRLAIVQRAVSKKTANGYADSQGLANQAMTDALGGKDQSGGGTQANANSPQAQQTVVSQDPRQNAQPVMQAAWVTTYKPLWLEGELLLVRAVGDGDGRRVQGVWLRKSALAESLLATMRDLLPDATLAPYQPLVFANHDVPQTESGAGRTYSWPSVEWFKEQPRAHERAPLALVSLPWQLVPGRQAAAVMPSWSPLHILLVAAWAGVALAMFSAAMLLGGVVTLSERRASFVSSVTHELRTPLTTFRLYSEMLADDMVADGEQRRSYLHTLQTEAARLTHLVENVLAYSRIERGSARVRIEETTVEELAARVVPRLEERARADNMKLDVEIPEDVTGVRLRADFTAAEQILFNLVDNACKYAAPPSGDGLLRISFRRAGRHLQIRVADRGPGIPPRERKRLFKPFHKSAQEAAVSKPGVGLGLSLSRRLARAIGGNLVWEPGDGPGTSFRLELPTF